MTDLEKLKEALEVAGVGAELHALLRKRIVELLNRKFQTPERSDKVKAMIASVADFLASEKLEFSKSILEAEAGFDLARFKPRRPMFPQTMDAEAQTSDDFSFNSSF